MATITLSHGGKNIESHSIHAGQTIRKGWQKGIEHPDKVSLEYDGETVEKDLKRGATDKKGFGHLSVVITSKGKLQVIAHVVLGNNPKYPSWNYTLQCKAKGEPSGCSRCGAVSHLGFDLVNDKPVCPSCRKSEGVAS